MTAWRLSLCESLQRKSTQICRYYDWRWPCIQRQATFSILDFEVYIAIPSFDGLEKVGVSQMIEYERWT